MNQKQEPKIWTDYFGRSWRMSEITDIHLANIIKYLQDRNHPYSLGKLVNFLKEAQARGLTSDFLAQAEIPYPHPITKELVKWDDATYSPQPVSNTYA